MKTKFTETINQNKGLKERLYKVYWISPNTTNKAYNTNNILLWSKEKIYNALIDLKIITQEEVPHFINLFEEIKEVWVENK